MLSPASSIGKVQSAEAKCLAKRRILEVDNCSHRHGSHASIKIVGPRIRRCSSSKVQTTRELEQLSTDRRSYLLKPCSKVLPKGNTQYWKQQTGVSPTEDQIRVQDLEPRLRVLYSRGLPEGGSEGLFGKSAKTTLTLDQSRPVELQGQGTTKASHIIENIVDACFSSSSSLSLVTGYVDEAHTQHETSLSDKSANLPATNHDQPGSRRAERGRSETALAKIWKRKKDERRIGGLLLLNGLAAVYGSSNVANKYVAEAAPALPASLISLVKFTSALIFFIPSLFSALKNRETDLLRAGAELGALAFAASFVDSCNPGGSSSNSPSLLYAFTVIFVPLMELLAGRQSGLKLTRLATLAAVILGMGVLEEEGFGWKGVSCPQISDLWGVAVSVILTLHIFRSDAHGRKFDPLRLNAVQCGVLAILSLGWEVWTTFDARALQSHVLSVDVVDSLQSIPWVPLLYNGLVCSGLCSWLELRGLRSVHASVATLVYTTIPVWGAFLSFFASHDVPTDSAVIGGLVIAATSIYAQILSKDDDLSRVEAQSTAAPSTLDSSTSTTSIKSSKEKAAAAPVENDYFPAGLLVSQLKFPYYAAQAKVLLAELKFKLGALKSLGLVFTWMSSSNVLVTNSNAATTAATTTSTTATTTAANNMTTSQIGTAASQAIDASNAAALHVPHGTDVATTTAISAAHSVSTVVAFLPPRITAGFGSALVAAGSDITMAVEEAEDVAAILERLVQGGADSVVHLVTAALTTRGSLGMISSSLTPPDPTPQVAANFVDTSAPQLPGALDIQLDLLMNLSHLTDVVVNGFCQLSHLVLPLVNNVAI